MDNYLKAIYDYNIIEMIDIKPIHISHYLTFLLLKLWDVNKYFGHNKHIFNYIFTQCYQSKGLITKCGWVFPI